jgi:hypothetical protein
MISSEGTDYRDFLELTVNTDSMQDSETLVIFLMKDYNSTFFKCQSTQPSSKVLRFSRFSSGKITDINIVVHTDIPHYPDILMNFLRKNCQYKLSSNTN